MRSRDNQGQGTDAKTKFEIGAGWRYGLVLAFVLIAFGWGWDAWQLASASAELSFSKLVLATILILPLTVAAGLLAAHAHNSALRKWMIWTVWGMLLGLIAVRLPFDGMSLIASLLDPTVRGSVLFPFTSAAETFAWLAAFLGALAGFPVALLHILATEQAWDRSTRDNRFTAWAWVSLCVGVPMAIVLAILCDYTGNATLREPIQATNRAIQIALSTPPDLDIAKMPTNQAFEYEAGLPWRDKLSTRFVEYLADFDPDAFQQLTVDVAFDNGLILRCQTTHYGQIISACIDLGANYREAFVQFITTGTAPCKDCTIQVQPEAAAWRAQHRGGTGDMGQISVVHHSGGAVIVRSEFDDGRHLECRFDGADPVRLQSCMDRE